MFRTLARIGTAATALVLVTLGVVAPAGEAATQNKTAVASATVTDGAGNAVALSPTSPARVNITLANTTKQPQSFGSANITMPSGYTVCTTPSPCTGVTLTGSTTGFFVPVASVTNVIQLRSSTNSGVAPGSSITIQVWVSVAQASCTTPWGVAIKQSNDFSGTGNDFVVNNITPGAHLAFTRQPVDSQWNVAMSPGPRVTAYDACGNVVSTLASTITLTDSSAALATGSSATPVSGVATFGNLTFSTYPLVDTLTASAAGFTSTTSASFLVAQVVSICPPTCTTGNVPNTDGSLNTLVNLSAVQPSTGTGSLVVSVRGDPGSICDSGEAGTETPYGTLATLSSPLQKTVTMTLPKKYVNAISNNGTPFMDICLQTDTPFTDKSGDSVTEGLLPDCGDVADQPPCIVSRNKNAGNEIVVFNLIAGDPKGAWYG